MGGNELERNIFNITNIGKVSDFGTVCYFHITLVILVLDTIPFTMESQT